MKRFFVLLCMICALYTFSVFSACGLSWANNFGSSIEGEQAVVTFTHTADCDSARAEFGYDGDGGADTLNFYETLDLTPCFSGDGKLLMGDTLDLDSIGTHIVKITYFENDGDAVADGYVAGIWTHEDPTPGDTIQRDASTFDVSTDTVIWVDTVLYAGAAQKNTEAEITGWVKATLEDTSNIARDATKDDYKDGVGGTGSYKDTILVLDGDTNTVEGVSITVRNASGTVVAVGETDVNGTQILNLDATTYTFSLQRIGIILNQDTTLTVSGDQTDTIWVTAYDIGSPPSANVTRVKGFTRTYGYQKTDRVTVSFSTHDRNLIDTTAGVFIDKIDEVTYSDTGFFQIDLIPSVSLLSKQPGIEKDSILYDIKIYAPGRSVFEWQNIFIPDTSGSIWLKDLLE